MKHLRDLADDLLKWGEAESAVEAILWYGSTGRGDSGPTSDLDTVILQSETASASDMFQSLLGFLGDRVQFSSFLPSRKEAKIWTDSSLTMIDLHFGDDPERFAWLADCADVPSPRLVIGLDKHDRCGNIVARASANLERSVPDLLNEEVEKFLCGFEAASSAHRQSDGYQFYFHYNLALHRLARIIELLRGAPVYLFLPKHLLPKRMPLPEQKLWRALHGSLYLPEANELKRRLADRFLEAIQEAKSRFELDRLPTDAKQFIEAVLQRDLFFNVRDFAGAFGGRVRPGVLFRASTLTRWREEPALADWLGTNRIRTIIDLRMPHEAEGLHGGYPDELLDGIQYFNVPLQGPPLAGSLPPASPEMGTAYIEMFKSHFAAIANALQAVASANDGAIVVHCHVGKDRTGVFCAVLGLLLELPEDDIVADYVLSGQGVSDQAIRQFTHWFQQSDAPQLLGGVGVDETVIAALRSRLVVWD